jgi:hypothetical protein
MDLIRIGYWRSYSEPDLPDPADLVDHGVDLKIRGLIIDHLKNGRVYESWRGYSYCRFDCGHPDESMGHRCLTDGTYLWPEGLVHYVECHGVWLPPEFVENIRAGSVSGY